MKPVLQIQWIYLILGIFVGIALLIRGALLMRAFNRQPNLENRLEIVDEKTRKKRRSQKHSPEFRIAYRSLVNGIAIVLACVVLAIVKLTA